MTTAIIILLLVVLAPVIVGASISIQRAIANRPNPQQRLEKGLAQLEREKSNYPEGSPERMMLDVYIAELEQTKFKRIDKKVKELTGK